MLKGKITSMSNDLSVIAFGDGQTMSVGISDIEGVVKVGSEIVVVVAALGTEDAGRTQLAQGLLNELLKG